MKKLAWLTLFGWPALMVIIFLSLLASPLLLSRKARPPPGPWAAAPEVKYTIRNAANPVVSEETAQIRALYAPDLFASSRGNQLSILQAATNHAAPKDTVPSPNPLFLFCPPAANETGVQWFAMTGRKIDNYAADPGFQVHPPGRTSHQAKQPALNLAAAGSPPRRTGRHPQLSVELQGELKHCSLDPDIFQNVVFPAGRKPWSPPLAGQTSAPLPAGSSATAVKPWAVQAEVRISSEGRVEHVFAESIDCEQSLYQEIIKKLYQCHFSNVTQTCAGLIIISYPAYFIPPADKPADHRQ